MTYLVTLLVSAVGNLVLVGMIFAPLERAYPARQQPLFRPAWRVDLTFFLGQALLVTVLAQGLVAHVAPWLAAVGPSTVRGAVARAAVWVQAPLVLVLGDLVVYWFHRACHRYDTLWRFHAVHHSPEHLDWLAAFREHPLDGIATQLLLNAPGILLGVRFEALGGVIAFRALWAIFVHSNVRLPLGPLGFLFGAPELHRWHHLRTRETTHNFANLAPYLDHLFGTHHCPHRDLVFPLGNPDPSPQGYVAQLAAPFRPSPVAASGGARVQVRREGSRG